jgi:N-acetylmuramoyl-L-alanine amidase
MNYIVDHIPRNTPHNRRPGTSMHPEYITIHSTGNPSSTARNERGWLTNPSNTRTASWHIVVDEKEAVEAIPLDEVAYHAGNKTGNYSSIGIEICESGDRAKTLANAANLVVKMLNERGWGVDKLLRPLAKEFFSLQFRN